MENMFIIKNKKLLQRLAGPRTLNTELIINRKTYSFAS